MQVAAKEVRVADIVTVPGVGEYEVRRIDRLGADVGLCVNKDPDNPCESRLTYSAQEVLEVQRPASLFGEGPRPPMPALPPRRGHVTRAEARAAATAGPPASFSPPA